MGYSTEYNLKLRNASAPDEDAILEFMKDLGVIHYALDENFSCCEGVNWFGYADDMRKVSKEFPHVHFILSGSGESNGDIWEHHFVGGKDARYDAEVVIPPFNEKDLR